MPRISHLAMLASTVALLLPACDPSDDPDASTGGPGDFSVAPDDPEDDTDPRPKPHRPDRLSDAPRDHDVVSEDADRPEDLVDAPHGHDACPEPPDHPEELADT